MPPEPLAYLNGQFLPPSEARLPLHDAGFALPSTVDPRIKQRSRLHWWLADRSARASQPGATALLLNESGHITETAAANFLLVQDGAVVSPPRSGILNGISLLVVEELCLNLGI